VFSSHRTFYAPQAPAYLTGFTFELQETLSMLQIWRVGRYAGVSVPDQRRINL
jgi:hypothetical protein